MKTQTRIFIALALLAPSLACAAVPRWYSSQQVAEGADIFERKCASCHGDQAQGDPDWRKPDAEGDYPPPPLNGNAYAWRYSLEQLRERIRVGRKREGGPGMKRRLNEAEIDAVIAFFQSTWDDITYVLWQSRQLPSSAMENASFPGAYWLKRHLRSTRVNPGQPMKTPVPGIREVRVRDDYIYLSEDGRYAFTGRMIDLSDGSDLTQQSEARHTRELVQQFASGNMLFYPAQGREKARLTIFTDTSCGFCRKMHHEVPELRRQGVAVQFIPYPRRGADSQGAHELERIWCSRQANRALNLYFESYDLPDATSDCNRTGSVAAGFELGNRIGISGTPLLILPDGRRMKGYNSASDVLEELKLQPSP